MDFHTKWKAMKMTKLSDISRLWPRKRDNYQDKTFDYAWGVSICFDVISIETLDLARHWEKVSLDSRENLDSYKKLVSTIEKSRSRLVLTVETPRLTFDNLESLTKAETVDQSVKSIGLAIYIW